MAVRTPVRHRSAIVAVVVAASVGLAACSSSGSKATSGTTVAGATTTAATAPVPKQVEKQKPSPGTGNVQGLVQFDDAPVPNIAVTLCGTFNRFLASSCGGDVFKATTGADGVFVVTDVKPGAYQALTVQVFDTNQVQFATSDFVGTQSYTVNADKTLFVNTTDLFKEDVQVTSPASGSEVVPTSVTFAWAAYPSAKYYKVSIYNQDTSVVSSPVVGQRVDGTSYLVPTAVPTGTYRLTVEAYNAKDTKLSESGDGYTFTVRG